MKYMVTLFVYLRMIKLHLMIICVHILKKKGFIVTKYVSEEHGESVTFADCVDIAKKNGFTIGIFYIMAEKPLEGTIFQYANCYDQEPFVSEYGKTRGYA